MEFLSTSFFTPNFYFMQHLVPMEVLNLYSHSQVCNVLRPLPYEVVSEVHSVICEHNSFSGPTSATDNYLDVMAFFSYRYLIYLRSLAMAHAIQLDEDGYFDAEVSGLSTAATLNCPVYLYGNLIESRLLIRGYDRSHFLVRVGDDVVEAFSSSHSLLSPGSLITLSYERSSRIVARRLSAAEVEKSQKVSIPPALSVLFSTLNSPVTVSGR